MNNARILANRPSNSPEPSVTTSFQANSLNIKTDSENWGYIFLGSSAINSLISNFESQAAVESLPEFGQRRERANEIIFDLLGQEPRLVYVRRKGAGQQPGEEIWDLTIATDHDDFQLPARLEKLGKTLGFIAVVEQDGRGGLKVLSAKLLELSQGNADGYTVPYRLRLLPNHQYRIDIPPTALAWMAAMPICGDHLPTEDHLRIWEAIPGKFKPEVDSTDLFNLELLRNIKTQFEYWQQQLQNEEIYLNRYQHFIQDWIGKLRKATEGNSTDLRRIYLNNANVVGITCVQAANRGFSEEFKYFDVVIIDEVSKCTPPELLIPALKSKKLVMVGDHRQLPPMLDTKTLEEVSQEIGSKNTELQLLQESLFKIQFEAANDSIKQMLNIQYRMHPIIMGAINQFYDGKLECGILEPDTKRAHNLAGEIIEESKHLIWVKTPGGNEFQEKRTGTSFYNIPEINAIEILCKQFETTWASRVAKGEPKKEIAVITFYGAQLRKIDERLQSELFPSLQITTGTVDRFQGMERPVVIVSMVRNNSKGDVGFAKKPERVNVAFSRAQELLVIVGCHSLFTQQGGQVGSMYSNVSNIVRLHGGFVDVSRLFC